MQMVCKSVNKWVSEFKHDKESLEQDLLNHTDHSHNPRYDLGSRGWPLLFTDDMVLLVKR